MTMVDVKLRFYIQYSLTKIVFIIAGNSFCTLFQTLQIKKKEANMNLLTKTKADILKLTVPERECYSAGELFPNIFDEDSSKEFKEGMILTAKIMYLGNFKVNSSVFPKIKCPVCNKEESLIPYFCGASVLSGAHVIKFYCTECHEHIAINNNSDYYHKIRDYILEHRKELDSEPATIIYKGKQISFIPKDIIL